MAMRFCIGALCGAVFLQAGCSAPTAPEKNTPSDKNSATPSARTVTLYVEGMTERLGPF